MGCGTCAPKKTKKSTKKTKKGKKQSQFNIEQGWLKKSALFSKRRQMYDKDSKENNKKDQERR